VSDVWECRGEEGGEVMIGVYRAKMPNGDGMYVVPANPFEKGRFMGWADIVENSKYFMARAAGTILAQSADTVHLLRMNARENAKRWEFEDWSTLWGREAGKICVMVCAGPSLTESLPQLAEMVKDKSKYFVVGVNRAIRAIDCDYFVMVDRRGQDDWITRDVSETVLIASTSASARIANRFTKSVWGETLAGGVDEGLTPLRTGLPITMTDAMHAVYKMGAEEIWLYGCDFALSGNNVNGQYLLDKYYFDEPAHAGLHIRPLDLHEMQAVIGVAGKTVFINYELWAYCCYATAMAMAIEESGGVKVRNKSGAGIMFYGHEDER
jgi:hypothetical protein